MIWFRYATLLGALTIAACGGRSADKTAGGGTPQAESAGGMMGMQGMDSGKGMGGMRMPMQGMEMMSMMRAHMDSVAHMSPEQMRAMMPQHEAMMSRMMDAMGSDMRGMRMEGDAAWNALADSVKRDLADLPSLEGKALAERMKAHAGRVTRLMATHKQMMKGMESR